MCVPRPHDQFGGLRWVVQTGVSVLPLREGRGPGPLVRLTAGCGRRLKDGTLTDVSVLRDSSTTGGEESRKE